MKCGVINPKTRLNLIAAVILLAGLGSALLIFFTAGNDYHSGLGYEVVDGQVYTVAPEDSKTYVHDLELYGGKLNVLADQFIRWFAGLWHGKSLAFTIACITILISSGFFFVADRLTCDLEADGRGKDCRHGSE